MGGITAIIPTYCVERYLERCVRSLLHQTYENCELVLVDDGSPDHGAEMCDEFLMEDSRLLCIHQPNGGLSAARNVGIDWAFACSENDWLTFVDGDDWLHETMLETLLTAAENKKTQTAICGYYRVADEEAPPEPELPQIAVVFPDELVLRKTYRGEACYSYLSAWGKLYAKELFRPVRYPIGKIHEDRFTTHRLLFVCDRVAVVFSGLYYYAQSPYSITRSAWRPCRLDDIEAHEIQLSFFKQGGFSKAYEETAFSYRYWLFEQLCQIRKNPQYRKQYFHPVRKKLNVALRSYRKLGRITLWKTPWYYRYSRPVSANAVWTAKKCYHTVKKVWQ